MPDSSGTSLAIKSDLDTRTNSCQEDRKSSDSASTSSPDLRKKGSHGDGVPDMLQSTTSSVSSSSVVQADTPAKFLDQWRSH